MREELGIDESAAVRGAQRPAQGPTQRERRSAPRIRFAKQSLRKAALWALSAWNASAHALPAYSWAPIVPISYAMLANFTVHGCACSGVSNPYGFGAYCARWETPTQNPWCYVLADCPTGGAAGDYGKFEDCAEAPTPWSDAAADAAEATVDAAALQPLAAAAATSLPPPPPTPPPPPPRRRRRRRRGARARRCCACCRRRSRSSATPSAGCGASTSSSSASTTPSPRRGSRCGRRRQRGRRRPRLRARGRRAGPSGRCGAPPPRPRAGRRAARPPTPLTSTPPSRSARSLRTSSVRRAACAAR